MRRARKDHENKGNGMRRHRLKSRDRQGGKGSNDVDADNEHENSFPNRCRSEDQPNPKSIPNLEGNMSTGPLSEHEAEARLVCWWRIDRLLAGNTPVGLGRFARSTR